MARVTDPQKLARIRDCTMDLIVRNGYAGITIAAVASNAGVSVGYLYRHYAGKDELVTDLVIQNFETLRQTVTALLEQSTDIAEVVRYYLTVLFSLAETEPIKARFISILYRDVRFREIARAQKLLNIPEVAARLLEKGQLTGEIRQDATVDEAMLFLLNLPLDYLFLRLEGDRGPEDFSAATIRRLSEMCLKALI